MGDNLTRHTLQRRDNQFDLRWLQDNRQSVSSLLELLQRGDQHIELLAGLGGTGSDHYGVSDGPASQQTAQLVGDPPGSAHSVHQSWSQRSVSEIGAAVSALHRVCAV